MKEPIKIPNMVGLRPSFFLTETKGSVLTLKLRPASPYPTWMLSVYFLEMVAAYPPAMLWATTFFDN